MPKSIPAINEVLDDLQTRLRIEKRALPKRRLHMLVLFKTGQARSRKAVADHLAVHRNTISTWITRYQSGGLEALLEDQKSGPKTGQRTLSPPALDALKTRLDTTDGFGSYGEIETWLQSAFGLEVKYKTIHDIVRYQLGAKLKVGRRSHVKKNSIKQ